jgi:surfactin synthase thioesterase subunit
MDLLKQLGDTPVYVVMGDKDKLVPVATVRQWVDEMKRLKTPVTYEEIAGGDHVRCITQNEAMIGRVFDFFDAASEKAKAKETDAKEKSEKPAPKADDGTKKQAA